MLPLHAKQQRLCEETGTDCTSAFWEADVVVSWLNLS